MNPWTIIGWVIVFLIFSPILFLLAGFVIKLLVEAPFFVGGAAVLFGAYLLFRRQPEGE